MRKAACLLWTLLILLLLCGCQKTATEPVPETQPEPQTAAEPEIADRFAVRLELTDPLTLRFDHEGKLLDTEGSDAARALCQAAAGAEAADCVKAVTERAAQEGLIPESGSLTLTLLHDQTFAVPSATVDAIRQAAAEGVLTLIPPPAPKPEIRTEIPQEPEESEAPMPEENPEAEQSAAICSLCGGSGICVDCHGAGTFGCDACKSAGSTECPSCAGVGESYCPACGGNGSCTICGASGSLPCRFCGGAGCEACAYSGSLVCEACGGAGICGTCGGGGFLRCQSCGGEGALPCSGCSGSGAVNCGRCGGSGFCPWCGGSGTE